MLLLGGGGATQIGAQPINPVTVADYQAVENICVVTKKGAACHIDRPARLVIVTRKAHAEIDARPGEQAEVWLNGLEIYCRDGGSPPQP